MLDVNILLHCYSQQFGTEMFCARSLEYFLDILEEGSLLVQIQHPRNTAVLHRVDNTA